MGGYSTQAPSTSLCHYRNSYARETLRVGVNDLQFQHTVPEKEEENASAPASALLQTCDMQTVTICRRECVCRFAENRCREQAQTGKLAMEMAQVAQVLMYVGFELPTFSEHTQRAVALKFQSWNF